MACQNLASPPLHVTTCDSHVADRFEFTTFRRRAEALMREEQ